MSAEPLVPPPTVSPKTPASPTTASKKPTREKKQPTGDYPNGYCRTEEKNRFKKGNLGGPGRPKKDTKSQDDLMRAELLKLQTVTEGGRRRRKSTRELIPGIYVKATLQKLSPKELRALQDEARRLWPARPVDEDTIVVNDPVADREYLRTMLSALEIGEPDGAGGDVLGDIGITGFGADDEDDDNAWNEGDWNASDEKQTDEKA